MTDLETRVLVNTLTEALIELGINAGERGEKYPLVIGDLVPAIKKLKADLAAKQGELQMVEAVQERLENDMKEQFDMAQASLIGFVMFKCGRKKLAIDSREITDETKYGGQAITVTAIDPFTTQYQIRPLKGARHGR